MRGINHLDPLTDETALECRRLVKDNQPQASQVGGEERNQFSVYFTNCSALKYIWKMKYK